MNSATRRRFAYFTGEGMTLGTGKNEQEDDATRCWSLDRPGGTGRAGPDQKLGPLQ